MKQLKIYTDGACSGNPGEAGVGVVIRQGPNEVWRLSKAIGKATNNIAEYTAVIYALQQALILKADEVILCTDSELFCKQFHGEYRIKNPNIKFLFDLVMHLRAGFRHVEVTHVPRDRNKEADRLAKQAIKAEPAQVVAPLFIFGEESPSSIG